MAILIVENTTDDGLGERRTSNLYRIEIDTGDYGIKAAGRDAVEMIDKMKNLDENRKAEQ